MRKDGVQKRVRVLVIDDSAAIRRFLVEALASDPGVEVVGEAGDPYEAKEKIKQLDPDVLTLDIIMPKMNGLAFLKNLMRLRPMPVVMSSTLTREGAAATLAALELGAVDFIPKPDAAGAGSREEWIRDFTAKVKAAAGARVRRLPPRIAPRRVVGVAPAPPEVGTATWRRIVVIGASAGGTVAVEHLLAALPENSPPIVAALHMPARFTTLLAQRLDCLSRVRVAEAADGDPLLPGRALIAPGGLHTAVVRRGGGGWAVHVYDGDRVNRHKPSVDVLFTSTAEAAGRDAVGVILTGMGGDGAEGLARMRRAGAATVAQDEETCLVFGMPKEAIRRGAVDHVAPLPAIPSLILHLGKEG